MTMPNFPRGGKKVQTKNINKNAGPSIHKKSRKGGQKSKEDKLKKKPVSHTLNDARNLNFLTIQPQTNILCRVHKVFKLDLIVNMPGFLSAKISIADISKSYTNLLKEIANDEVHDPNEYKELKDIYKPGDYLVCNVKELLNNSSFICKCTIVPAHVNYNVNPSFLSPGCAFVCSVSSIEDNGLVMETGIPNVRAFIEKKKKHQDNYCIGKQILCAIKKITVSDNVYSLLLSDSPKYENPEEQQKQPLDNMVPGSGYDLTVNRILPCGVEVVYNEDKIGYINQVHLPKALKAYEKGSQLSGILLYTIQLYKFPFFSALPLDQEELTFQTGDIVEDARFCCKESGGVILKLAKGIRCYISNRRTGIDYLNIDKTFVPHSKHKCRVIGYGSMDRMYVCSMEKKLLEEQYFTKENFQVGALHDVTVTHIGEDNWTEVRFGRVMGVIPPEELRDRGQELELKVGQKIPAKVLRHDPRSNKVVFTTKQSVVNCDLPFLKDIGEAVVGELHMATVKKVQKTGLMVVCMGGAKGWIPEKNLKKPLVLEKNSQKKKHYFRRQTLVVRVEDINPEDSVVILKESVVKEEKAEKPEKLSEFSIGDEVEGTVIDASLEGIHLKIPGLPDGDTAFLPSGHLAPCMDLGTLIASKTELGESMTATIFSIFPKMVLTRSIMPPKGLTLNKLKCGDLIPCSLLHHGEYAVNVIIPCEDFFGTAHTSLAFSAKDEALYGYQIKIGLIQDVNRKEERVKLYTGFNEIIKRTPESVMCSVDLLQLYLRKFAEVSQMAYLKDKPLRSLKIGQKMKGKVTSVSDTGLVLELANGATALVRKGHYEKAYTVGEQVLTGVLWVNYVYEVAEVTVIPRIISSITSKPLPKQVIEEGQLMRGTIVFANSWLALVALKGQAKNVLVAIPVRRHLNDLNPRVEDFELNKKVRVYGVLHQNEINVPISICMLKVAFEDVAEIKDKTQSVKRKIDEKDLKKAKKMKLKVEARDESEETDQQVEEGEDIEVKEEAEESEKEEDIEMQETKVVEEKVKPKLNEAVKEESKKKTILEMPECGFVWDTSATPTIEDEEASSMSEEEEDADSQPKKKKKKLSALERREEERQKERAIREREEFLASGNVPNSVDQFDRMVLAQPDSSMVWIQYMTFHLQMAEIDKARSVAKRAVSSINFREEEERLNVWKAWLNLESKYGTANESLKEVFQDAVKANDAKEIYQHMLIIYADAGKLAELEDTIKAICGKNGKMKQDADMWVHCGAAFLKVNCKEKARMLMQRALQSLPPQQHVNLIIKFAHLENKFGDKERAQTLFEQVLASYPKRTDIWNSYVDLAVKTGDIEMARTILARAVTKPIPPKKMKSLFKRYLDFETQHGTPQSIEEVRKLAAKYVEEQCN